MPRPGAAREHGDQRTIAITGPPATATRSAMTLSASSAHSFDLSVWHDVHGFGMPWRSDMAGEMNLKVWLRTLTLAIVCANRRHVAGDTLAAFAVGSVLRVKRERAAWSRLHHAVVALDRHTSLPGSRKVGLVLRAMRIVTRVAPHALQVHLALHVVVALHSVLVRRPSGQCVNVSLPN